MQINLVAVTIMEAIKIKDTHGIGYVSEVLHHNILFIIQLYLYLGFQGS